MSRICGIKRPRGQRTCQMQPNSGMGRLQQDYRQSQYSQYPGGDRYSPYPSMYNNNDNNPEPIETTSTSSSWKQERPTLAPDYPEPNEQTETNVGFSDYHQDGLQPTQQPCIGYIPQSQLSWVEDTQHRSTASNTVETEPDWDWPARTDYARDPIASAEYGVSHPNPCPLPLNQPATDFNFQGRENDPEISRLAGSTTAYCPPSNVSFPYVLSGLSPPALAAQGSEYLDTNNLGSLMSEIVDGIETNADQEPWSVYERNQSTQLTPQDYSNLGTYRNGTPNTNPSTFDYGDSESSYPTGDDSWTHISSNYPNNNSMNHSILTERPETFNFQESSAILPYPSFFAQIPVRPRVLLRGATPPVGPQDNAIDTSIRETGWVYILPLHCSAPLTSSDRMDLAKISCRRWSNTRIQPLAHQVLRRPQGHLKYSVTQTVVSQFSVACIGRVT